MANIRLIRRRIRSVRSIADVTRAMQMIAASKMRRAQERGLAGRAYAEKITQVIAHLASVSQEAHPLLQRRKLQRVEIVHITPDRGLCGGLVTNINRLVMSYVHAQPAPVSIISVGTKGFDFMRRFNVEMRAEFCKLGDRPNLLVTLPVSRVVINDYASGYCDAVFLAYTHFVSTIVQKPVVVQILPVEPAAPTAGVAPDYIFEPDPSGVLDHLLPRFVEMQVYHAILEAIASEQSARMVAMRNASENALELIEALTLSYNKARQESITTELLDITGGAAAVS